MTGSSTLQSSDITNPAQAINKLVAEFQEYLFPPEGQATQANLVSILQEVIPLLQGQMQRRGIRLDVVHRGSIPQLALDVPQVTRALEKILEFSVNILPQGGELCMETRVVEADGGDFVELRINIRSSIPLEFNDEEVFKPFARLYQYKAGLSLALAREIFRRNHGAISFRKHEPRQGSISLIIEANANR
jgi:nitrogen-specific signal transduction histidine kinase